MEKLLFGTAGIPLSTEPRNTINGIAQVRSLNLEAMELEFVRSINISEKKAPLVRQQAKKQDILLTCHASYYINLNSDKPKTKYGSMNRIENAAERLHQCGGWSVCFHPGYYLKMEKKKVYENIRDRIKEIRERLEEKDIDVWLRPETTGKPTQFGDLRELLDISQEVEKVMPVIDFSHLHARTNGKYNSSEEFRQVLDEVEDALGKEGLQNMHIHLSGIEYSQKGERNHINLQESDMQYQDLVDVWKEYDIRGVVISESPNIEEDSLLLKRLYER